MVCSFRYGREDDETMGLSFKKELILADEQIYPTSKHMKGQQTTRLQERLIKKLGSTSFPFQLNFPRHSPTSVSLMPAPDEVVSWLQLFSADCSSIFLYSGFTMWSWIFCQGICSDSRWWSQSIQQEIHCQHDDPKDPICSNETWKAAMHHGQKGFHVFSRGTGAGGHSWPSTLPPWHGDTG